MDVNIIKKHTLNSAKKRATLLRGPLCPQLLPVLRGLPSSQNGNDLEIEDEVTKLPDISYRVAWQLGRLLAVVDNVFTKSLLWFRGKIHSEAVRRTKEAADITFTGIKEYSEKLPEAVRGIAYAHDNPAVTTDANAFYRGYDGARTPRYANTVQPVDSMMSKVCSSFQYIDHIREVASLLTAATPIGEKNSPNIFNRANDPSSHEWAKVLEWILDVLFTGEIPLHYLVLDLESIPTVYPNILYNQTWLECVIDGALSLANHLEPEYANIKKELKRTVNDYLVTLLSSGAGAPLPYS
ncbi:hypothetical protein FNYG_14106 [Fusarium nygamai]|uniref:Uncharacterized protein n=1 Tax=Gibberella nygamai TaxID=42673 RepID=A0A2K0UTU9_GIBNY|nr:hypothetical protein FNYG_14106 [Fusarium nygamai]